MNKFQYDEALREAEHRRRMLGEPDHLFEAWFAASNITGVERAELGAWMITAALGFKEGGEYGKGKILAEFAQYLTHLADKAPR